MAQTPVSNRLDGITAKIESVYGTDPTPTVADDGVKVNARVWPALGGTHAFENLNEEAPSGSLISDAPSPPSGRIVELELIWRARGAGVAYSATDLPEADPILRACGLGRTDNFGAGTESLIYAPVDTGHESCTIWGYAGGMLRKFVGCRGNPIIPVNAGEQATMQFAMQGIELSDPTTLTLPAITYATPLAPPSQALSMDVGAWTPAAYAGQIDLGAQVVQLDDVNAAEGVEQFAINGFVSRWSISARTIALATYNPYADVQARTSRALDAHWGTVQYNKFDVAVTEAYVRDPSHTENQGFVAWDVEYILQDFALTFD